MLVVIEITDIHYCHRLWIPDILPAFLDSSLGTKGPGGPGNLRLAVRVQMALVSGTLLGEGGLHRTNRAQKESSRRSEDPGTRCQSAATSVCDLGLHSSMCVHLHLCTEETLGDP